MSPSIPSIAFEGRSRTTRDNRAGVRKTHDGTAVDLPPECSQKRLLIDESTSPTRVRNVDRAESDAMRVSRKPVTCDEQQRHMSQVSRKKSDVESSSEQIQNKIFECSIGSLDPKKLLKCPSQALHMLTLDGKGERETPDERGINTEI